ncbi:MAG: hypothetical protein KF819_22790 [Labilithrix sp.]|nr:hypothetical protein [Labilithrix sp.]
MLRFAIHASGAALLCAVSGCTATDIFPERGGLWIDEDDMGNLALDSDVRVEGVPYTRASACLDRCARIPTRARLRSVMCAVETCQATPISVESESERIWFTVRSSEPGLTTLTVGVTGGEGQEWTSNHPVRFWDPSRLELIGALGRSPEIVVTAGTSFSARVTAYAQTPAGEMRLRTGQGLPRLETQGAVDVAGQSVLAARPGQGEVAFRLGTARLARPVRVVSAEDVAGIEVHAATWDATPVIDETPLTSIAVGSTAASAFALAIPLHDGTTLTAIDAKPEIVPAEIASVATIRDEPLFFGISARRTGTGVLRVRVGAAVVELPLTVISTR